MNSTALNQSRTPTLYLHMLWRLMLDVFSRGTGFILNILIARCLGVQDFGKFGYAVSLTQIFYIFTDLGLHLQLVKELGESRRQGQSNWIEYFKLKIGLMLLCTLFLVALQGSLWHWDRPWLLSMILFWMFSNSMLDFNQAVCNGLGQIKLAQTVLIIQRLFLLISVGFTFIFARSLVGIVTGLAIGGMSGMIVSNWYLFKKLAMSVSIKPNFLEWKGILIRSFPNGVGVAFGSWYVRIGVILLAWDHSSKVLGEYSAAFRIFEIAYMLPTGVMGIAFPHLSESLALGRTVFLSEIKRILLVMLVLAASWMLIVVTGSAYIITYFYGATYIGAVPILRIFGFTGGIVALNYLITHLMIVIDSQVRHAVHEVLVFLIAATLSLTLIPTYGASGAAFAILGSELSLFVFTLFFIIRKWDSKFVGTDFAKIA